MLVSLGRTDLSNDPFQLSNAGYQPSGFVLGVGALVGVVDLVYTEAGLYMKSDPPRKKVAEQTYQTQLSTTRACWTSAITLSRSKRKPH